MFCPQMDELLAFPLTLDLSLTFLESSQETFRYQWYNLVKLLPTTETGTDLMLKLNILPPTVPLVSSVIGPVSSGGGV